MNARISALPANAPNGGPSVSATALWGTNGGLRMQLLTDTERAELAVISSIVRFSKGTQIYRHGATADSIFSLVRGVAKTYRSLPDNTEHITAFLFPDDLIGLMEEGKYVNSAEAVTPVVAYRIPVTALKTRLQKDAELEFHLISKIVHELREAQRHAFLLSRHRAVTKIALFLKMLENYQTARGENIDDIYLPMTRSDIADYVGMSLEAVTRSFHLLESKHILAFRNRRHVKIIDQPHLETMALARRAPPPPARRSGMD
jgi:CRP-like cAMP-binding protein